MSSNFALAAKQSQVQTFNATENDGTAQEIRTNTAADDADGPALSEAAPAAPARPTAKAVASDSAPTTADNNSEVAALKRQNAELARRLEALEQARAEKKQADALAAQPMVPAAAQASGASAASGAGAIAPATAAAATTALAPAPMTITAAPVPATPATALPADPLAARMRERNEVTEHARQELIAQDAAATKRQALLESGKKFDVVPDAYIPELAIRLKYANDILKRWGRAYDYRVTTTTDFKKILAELEDADEKAALKN